MEGYDKEKAARVWQRVQGSVAEDPTRGLQGMIAEEIGVVSLGDGVLVYVNNASAFEVVIVEGHLFAVDYNIFVSYRETGNGAVVNVGVFIFAVIAGTCSPRCRPISTNDQ